MTTALITHADCLHHETPSGHPERIARLETLLAHFKSKDYGDLLRVEAPLCSEEAILRVHPASYLDSIRNRIPRSGHTNLDPDTYLSPGSLDASLRAAGAAVCAVDMVTRGRSKKRVLCSTPAWPPCRNLPSHGVLHFWKRGHCRKTCPGFPWT